MQLASAWLVLDKHGSNVPLRGITPAELVILVRDRKDFIGKHPVHNLKITGESKRADSLERQRLGEKYGGSLKDRKVLKIDALYPGEGTPLPQTFESLGTLYTQSLDNELKTPIADVIDFEDSDLAKLEVEEVQSTEFSLPPTAE